MKTKDLFTAKFHCREPGDDAKAGNSRESIRAIFHAPATRRNPRAAGRRPGNRRIASSPSFRSASSQMTVQRDRKTR
jgi:hypothetical protein